MNAYFMIFKAFHAIFWSISVAFIVIIIYKGIARAAQPSPHRHRHRI